MTETHIVRSIATIAVLAIVWSVSSISTLITNDVSQEVRIQNIIDADGKLFFKQNVLSERISSINSEISGLSVSIGIIIKNQDRILIKLEEI